jgi:chemotaxis response regulator CheB
VNEPPVPIQILVPTLGAQQVPGTAPSHVLASGAHCIQGMAALSIVKMFRDMMMNQTKLLVKPVVNLKRVTANAVLVHPEDVMVNVARALMMIMNLDRSWILRSQLCRPSPKSTTRTVVRLSVTRMMSCRQSLMLTHERRKGLARTHQRSY